MRTKAAVAVLLLAILSSSIVIMLMLPVKAAGETQLLISPGVVNKNSSDVGTNFLVAITLSDFNNLMGFDINLTWDSSLISFVGADETPLNSLWSGGWAHVFDQSGAGFYELAASSTSTAASSTGASVLFSVTFHIDRAGSSPLSTPIHFALVKLSDNATPVPNSIPYTATDGTYTIAVAYQVTFRETGVGSEFAGTVMTVDGTNYSVSGLPVSLWWNPSSVHNFTFASSFNTGSGLQYFWVSTTGLSTVREGSLTVADSGSVTGNFATFRTLTISATAGGTTDPAPGTVTYMGYTQGKVVSVTALPNIGYKLDHWLLDNILVGPVNPIQVVVNSTHQLKAFFSEGWDLNIAVNGSGTTDPSQGTHSYPNGTIVTVTASPGIGYAFDHWLLDGNNNGTANTTHVLMNANHQLQALFKPLNCTLTILATTNGSINPSPGNHVYPYGTLVNVSAAPNTGYGLDHWLLDGNNAGAANPMQVSMTTNHQLTAVFAPSSTLNYTLTITPTVDGVTNPGAGNYVYPLGTVVTVTASPSTGYTFDHWELDGNNKGTVNTIQVTMNSTHQLQALFTALDYTLTITPTANGSTNPPPGSHVYSYGTAATVTAQPSNGYMLDHWLLENASAGAANPISVTMTANHQLAAVFAPFTGNYTLTVTATAGGTTSPLPGAYSYFSGTVVTVTASPSTGYTFDHWELDGITIGTTSSTQVTMNANHQLRAFFKSPLAAPAVWIMPENLGFDTVHTHVGDKFNVTVKISTTKPTYAWQVQVNYNASQLNVVRADYTGSGKSLFFTGHGSIPVSPTIDNQTGSVVHGESLIGFDQVPVGSNSLFWIEFMIMAAPAPDETLTSLVAIDTNPDNTFILDSDTNSVPGVGMGSAIYTLGYLPGVHDVAVTSLSLSSYTQRQGRNVTISVVALNNGTAPEAFEVTVTLDATLIAELNVPDLQPGNSTTLTLVWNTTAGTVGSHTITASAMGVPSDMDSTNNEKSRALTITSPTGPDTDINGDGRVDMVDIAMVSHAFGTQEGDARWIPAADINGDGTINMIDIATVARDFGRII